MKVNRLNIILSVLNILICTFTYAQFNHVGIKAGVNITNLHISQTDYVLLYDQEDFENKTSFNAGLVSQFSSNNVIAFSIGLLYYNTGCVDSAYSLTMHSLKLPFEVKVRIPVVDKVTIQTGFGPYGSFTFMARETMGVGSNKIPNEDILSFRKKYEGSPFGTSDDLKPYHPLDAGLVFGGEVEVELPNKTFLLIGFNYELGLLAVSNEWNYTERSGMPGPTDLWLNPNLKNRVMSVNIAYLFDVTRESKK